MEGKDKGRKSQGVQILIFECSVTVDGLISKVKESLEIFNPPSDEVLYSILNTFLGQLYSGVINEVRCIEIENGGGGTFALPDTDGERYACVRASDIKKIYADGYEYERVDEDYPSALCTEDDRLYFISSDDAVVILGADTVPDTIQLYYRAMPKLYSASEPQRLLCLPEEFVTLAEAKLRCEIYRLCGEEALCSNWTAEYNSIISSFRIWLEVCGI